MKGVQIVEPSFCLAVFCSAMAGDAECRPAKRPERDSRYANLGQAGMGRNGCSHPGGVESKAVGAKKRDRHPLSGMPISFLQGLFAAALLTK